MRMLLLCKYGEMGASSRCRFYQYLPFLKSRGIEAISVPLMPDSYLESLYLHRRRRLLSFLAGAARRVAVLLTSRHIDVIWLEQELLPWFPAMIESFLRRLALPPVVVDYDDAAFHRYDLHPRWLVRKFLGQKIDKVMSGAALVIAGNEYLAQRARQAGSDRVEVIPTAIDLDRYVGQEYSPTKSVTIGWIGTPLTSEYLSPVRSALRQIWKEGNVKIVAIGSGPLEWGDVPVEVRPWQRSAEVQELLGFDIGIMPLRDTEWERGKCGYKLIQYMACARPVVASPVGINREIVVHGSNGFLASSNEEWVTMLSTLKDQPELRRRMGQNGRAMVEEKYCIQVTGPRLVGFLEETVSEYGKKRRKNA